ncbi:MAG TPA: hypothetical protein VJQ56_10760 [Blastocatellia bacterium]|nr:hypothetical protein [Blastocatellia bacterium]
MLITFSGLDGAGKSTLIESLKSSLERQERRVVVFHMNKDFGVYAYLRFLRDIATGESDPAEEKHKTQVWAAARSYEGKSRLKALALRTRRAVLWGTSLRRGVYVIDLLIFLFYRLYVEKLQSRVLIMDRYFYDRLVDVDDGRRSNTLRLLEKLTPTPTVPIFLDISPEESYARKGEYSIDYLKRRAMSYRRVIPWVRSHIVLPTNSDPQTTARLLESVVNERLAAQ